MVSGLDTLPDLAPTRYVLDAVGSWRECAATAGVPDEETAQIAEDMQLHRPR